MSESLLAALLQFATRFGINAAIAFLESRGATLDDAITALRKAQAVSLEEMIAQDKASRLPPPTA
jgi:hypothetical protein